MIDDLEITRLCARAAGVTVTTKHKVFSEGEYCVTKNGTVYDPMNDSAQALELEERLRMDIYHFRAEDGTEMVQVSKAFDQHTDINQVEPVTDLLRAICVCAARVQQAREAE